MKAVAWITFSSLCPNSLLDATRTANRVPHLSSSSLSGLQFYGSHFPSKAANMVRKQELQQIMATIAILGTMDTKGEEHGYVADIIREKGHSALVNDVGALEPPKLKPDVTRSEE